MLKWEFVDIVAGRWLTIGQHLRNLLRKVSSKVGIGFKRACFKSKGMLIREVAVTVIADSDQVSCLGVKTRN